MIPRTPIQVLKCGGRAIFKMRQLKIQLQNDMKILRQKQKKCLEVNILISSP